MVKTREMKSSARGNSARTRRTKSLKNQIVCENCLGLIKSINHVR